MQQLYEIYVREEFSAAHSLTGYPGPCANIHGHNWAVEAVFRCNKLNTLGMAVDFMEVKTALSESLDKLDHTNLNDAPEFASANPTAENLAKFLFAELAAKLNTDHTWVHKVIVFETPGCGASYGEE